MGEIREFEGTRIVTERKLERFLVDLEGEIQCLTGEHVKDNFIGGLSIIKIRDSDWERVKSEWEGDYGLFFRSQVSRFAPTDACAYTVGVGSGLDVVGIGNVSEKTYVYPVVYWKKR